VEQAPQVVIPQQLTGNMNSLLLRTTCAQNGLQLSDEQLRRLDEYAIRLLEWNKKINLISRRDEENFWTRHILHCISLMFKVDFAEGVKIVDLGTGGGFLGLC
jgi:16S rRNA G527 N7-methylase RsmG